MMVSILVYKTFDLVSIHADAKYLNKGDIFLPDGTGWEYEVINKVLRVEESGTVLNVMVKPLSKGAKEYARTNQMNIDLNRTL